MAFPVTAQKSTERPGLRNPQGFSLLELIVVLSITLIVIVMGFPLVNSALKNYQLSGSAKGIANQLSLAKMRASADFTKTRLTFNLSQNSYQLETWKKSASAFQVEGGVLSLPPGVTFGYGAITTPAGGQSTILQTTPITFNSRGIPIDSGGVPVGNSAIYLGNAIGHYWAVTASVSGHVKVWRYEGTAWKGF